jgi:hypothetical protein
MPYFVKVAANAANKSGVSSKGYQIFRRGKTVTIRFGPIEVRPRQSFHWLSFQEQVRKFGTLANAREWLAEELLRREVNEKYSRLPLGRKILPRRG